MDLPNLKKAKTTQWHSGRLKTDADWVVYDRDRYSPKYVPPAGTNVVFRAEADLLGLVVVRIYPPRGPIQWFKMDMEHFKERVEPDRMEDGKAAPLQPPVAREVENARAMATVKYR